MTELSTSLDKIMERVREDFVSKNVAREKALPLCRDAIRFSANAIRAVHRNDFETAQTLVDKARDQVTTAKRSLDGHADIYHAGFVHDAEKEYAEAHARWEAHRAQIEKAAQEDAEAASAPAASTSYSSGGPSTEDTGADSGAGLNMGEGTLASDEALAALREKLTGN